MPLILRRDELTYEDLNVELQVADGLLHVAGQVNPATRLREPMVRVKVLQVAVPITGHFEKGLDIRAGLDRVEAALAGWVSRMCGYL